MFPVTPLRHRLASVFSTKERQPIFSRQVVPALSELLTHNALLLGFGVQCLYICCFWRIWRPREEEDLPRALVSVDGY
jgi:hypothetical protein